MYLQDSVDKDFLIGWAAFHKLRLKHVQMPLNVPGFIRENYGNRIADGAEEALKYYSRLDLDRPLTDMSLWQDFYKS